MTGRRPAPLTRISRLPAGRGHLASLLPGPDAAARAASFAARVPASYRERTPPEEAALDIAELAALADSPVRGEPHQPG